MSDANHSQESPNTGPAPAASSSPVNAKATVDCPYCLEPIISGATKCKHCGSRLPASNEPDHGGICPFCLENINTKAIRCMHCQSNLSPSDIDRERIESLLSPTVAGGCTSCGDAFDQSDEYTREFQGWDPMVPNVPGPAAMPSSASGGEWVAREIPGANGAAPGSTIGPSPRCHNERYWMCNLNYCGWVYYRVCRKRGAGLLA